MTQNQDDITTMFETTVTFLDKSDSIWKGTPAFAGAVARAKEGTAYPEQDRPAAVAHRWHHG
jgi:hypothetical protein